MSAARRLLAAVAPASRRMMSTTSRYRSSTIDIPNVSLTQYIMESIKDVKGPAIVDAPTGQVITYEEFPSRIAAAAKGLRAAGVQKGNVVGIHMPNHSSYIVAFQAIASLGAISTTSNPLYTPTELAHQLRDSGASYVITMRPFYDTVKAAAEMNTGVKAIFVVGEASASWLTDPSPPKAQPDIDGSINPAKDILVLPYSSGTTGLPKGVMLSHANLVSNVAQCSEDPDLNIDMRRGDVVYGMLPAYHIYGMTVVMATALRQACTLVMVPKFDPIPFLETWQKYKVSYAPLVPPVINFLARHPAVDKFNLSSARVIFSGAAPLDAETQSLAEKRFPGCSVRQGYGMTEMSPVSHIPRPSRVIPGCIGIPVPNTECKIVDEEGRELPPGPTNRGELCVRGPQVMLGYLNNAEATKRTLIDGFCHTGDVAWRDEAGNTYIVDRLKELIKVKGFQCAPAELEGLLLTHPLVGDVAVTGKPDPKSGEVPVAFVVKKATVLKASGMAEAAAKLPEVTEAQLQDFLRPKVAEYKVPAQVIFVDAIPKSAAGKILKRLLKEKLAAQQA